MSSFLRLKFCIYMLLLLLISSCGLPENQSICLYSEDFGDLVRKRVVLKASDSSWVKVSGLELIAGQPLQLSVGGEINLCSTRKEVVLDLDYNKDSFFESTLENKVYFLSPKNQGNWMPTNIRLFDGDIFTLQVKNNSYWVDQTTNVCPQNGIDFDDQCRAHKGREFFVSLGPPKNCLVDTEKTKDSSIFKKPSFPGTDFNSCASSLNSKEPTFFEVYNRECLKVKNSLSEYSYVSVLGGVFSTKDSYVNEDGVTIEYYKDFFDSSNNSKILTAILTEGVPELSEGSYGSVVYQYVNESNPPEVYSCYPNGVHQSFSNSYNQLYFKYNNFGENTGDGGYDINLKVQRSCKGMNGQYLQMRYGENGEIVDIFDYNQGFEQGLYFYNSTIPLNVSSGSHLYVRILDSKDHDWDKDGQPDYLGDDNYTEVIYGPYNEATGTKEIVSGSNMGEYFIDITTKSPIKTFFTDLSSGIIDPIKEMLNGNPETGEPGVTEVFFKSMIKEGGYIDAIRALIAASIICFAMSYMIGLMDISFPVFMSYVFKVSFVLLLFSPTSWEYFYRYLFSFFVEGVDDLLYILNKDFITILDFGATDKSGYDLSQTIPGYEDSPCSGEDCYSGGEDTSESNYEKTQQKILEDPFGFVNRTLSLFFNSSSNWKTLSLITATPFSFILFIMIYLGIVTYMFAIIKAFLVYISSMIMVSLMIFLGPVFIPMILFETTKGLFEGWIKNLMTFTLQPVMVLCTVAIFNVFVFSAFYNMMSFDVCWECAFLLDLPFSELMHSPTNFDRICFISNYIPWGMDPSSHNMTDKLSVMPISIIDVFIFVLMSSTMLLFVDWAMQVSIALIGSQSSMGVSNAVRQASYNIRQFSASSGEGVKNFAKGIDKHAGGLFSSIRKDHKSKTKRNTNAPDLSGGEKGKKRSNTAVSSGIKEESDD